MIPSDFLDRLRGADRVTWERIARGIPLKPCGQYFAYDQGKPSAHQYEDVYIPFGKLIPEVALAWLQACLQVAIRARGWAYQVSISFQGTRYGKIVTMNVDGSKHFHQDEHGDTEAEALLKAYLAAITEGKGDEF